MSTEPCTIRNARHDDAPILCELSHELGYHVEVGDMAERVFRLDPSQQALFVAEVDGQVVGWIDVVLVFRIQSGVRAEIGGLVVAASARGRGIGSRLLHRAEEWARQKGMKTVQLRSNIKRVEAHRFYLNEKYNQIKTQEIFKKML